MKDKLFLWLKFGTEKALRLTWIDSVYLLTECNYFLRDFKIKQVLCCLAQGMRRIRDNPAMHSSPVGGFKSSLCEATIRNETREMNTVESKTF